MLTESKSIWSRIDDVILWSFKFELQFFRMKVINFIQTTFRRIKQCWFFTPCQYIRSWIQIIRISNWNSNFKLRIDECLRGKRRRKEKMEVNDIDTTYWVGAERSDSVISLWWRVVSALSTFKCFDTEGKPFPQRRHCVYVYKKLQKNPVGKFRVALSPGLARVLDWRLLF